MKAIVPRRYAIYHLKVQGLYALGHLRLLSTMPYSIFQSETPPKSQEKVAKMWNVYERSFLPRLIE